MKVTVLNLPFQPEQGKFATGELEQLNTTDHIISASEHLFFHDGLPNLVLVVSHREKLTHSSPVEQPQKPAKTDWRAKLAPP